MTGPPSERGVGSLDEQRLSRIEDKLDKLSEGFTALVRMDERLLTVLNRMNSYDTRQEGLASRLALIEREGPVLGGLPARVTALEIVNTRRGPLFVWMERAAIAALSLAVAAAWGWFQQGGNGP